MNVEEYVKRTVKPIFDKVALEATNNRVSVGSVGFKNNLVFYQPHNCRVYFDYVKPSKPTFGGSVHIKNSTELEFNDLILGCRVTIKKTCVEVVNLVDKDKRFVVHMDSSGSETVDIISSKIKETRKVMEFIVKKYGGVSKFQVVNFSIQDNKVESESFIDSIDIKAKFRNKVVKKVYNERNVEFSDPSFAANYLTNQAALMDGFDIVKWCEDNISCLDDVFRLESTIRLMSYDNRLFLSSYLFAINDRLNGGVK
jgi:hypothetical protein